MAIEVPTTPAESTLPAQPGSVGGQEPEGSRAAPCARAAGDRSSAGDRGQSTTVLYILCFLQINLTVRPRFEKVQYTRTYRPCWSCPAADTIDEYHIT